MKNINVLTGILLIFSFLFVFSCKEQNAEPVNAKATSAPDIKEYVTHLPEAPGYIAFSTNCLICHSAAYIQNQPDFPEKTWSAIVTKMQKTFGAPVPDSSVNGIVQYLVAIKGKN